MGQLYEKMASDLKLRRYSARTQKSYLWCARRFVRHFMRSPAEMGSKEIREFLLFHHERGASASTIKMYDRWRLGTASPDSSIRASLPSRLVRHLELSSCFLLRPLPA